MCIRDRSSAVATRLAALGTQLAQAQHAGNTRGVHVLRERMAELTREQSVLATMESRLLGRCPGAGGSSGPVIVA